MTAYEGWALLEQMGFKKRVGKIAEVEMYGAKLLRLEVPFFNGSDTTPAGFVTEFAGGQSIYNVTPLAEGRRQLPPRWKRKPDRSNGKPTTFVYSACGRTTIARSSRTGGSVPLFSAVSGEPSRGRGGETSRARRRRSAA